MEDIILYFAVKYEGDFEKIFYAIMSKEEVDYSKVKEYKDSLDCEYSTIISKDYPLKLKQLKRPPFVVVYKGDLSLLNNKCIISYGTVLPI